MTYVDPSTLDPKVREEQKQATLRRLEAAGYIDPNCAGCQEWYDHPDAQPFAPSHNALSSCRSGGHNHCTCDSCF